MQLGSALDAIVDAGIPAATKRFGSALNVRWVDEALQHTGTMSVRRRRLPARLVVRLVISMALFRDCAIRTVATQLGLPNPWGKARSGHRDRSVASTAGHAQRLVIDYAEHRPVTTRTHLAGSYRLELLVNGTSLGVVDFELKCP